jgi:hypothetical protein
VESSVPHCQLFASTAKNRAGQYIHVVKMAYAIACHYKILGACNPPPTRTTWAFGFST